MSGQRFGSTAPTPGLNTSSVVGARRIRGRTTMARDWPAGARSARRASAAPPRPAWARRFGTSGFSLGEGRPLVGNDGRARRDATSGAARWAARAPRGRRGTSLALGAWYQQLTSIVARPVTATLSTAYSTGTRRRRPGARRPASGSRASSSSSNASWPVSTPILRTHPATRSARRGRRRRRSACRRRPPKQPPTTRVRSVVFGVGQDRGRPVAAANSHGRAGEISLCDAEGRHRAHGPRATLVVVRMPPGSRGAHLPAARDAPHAKPAMAAAPSAPAFDNRRISR